MADLTPRRSEISDSVRVLSRGGPDLEVLYVTSLSDTGNTIKTDDPRAGRLLAVHGTGVRGLPEARFADSVRPTAGTSSTSESMTKEAHT